MDKSCNKILAFTLGKFSYALDLFAVEHIVNAVEITPLPNGPEVVMGVINYHGEIIPVVDLRKRFKIESVQIIPEFIFIIARTPERLIAIVADFVQGLFDKIPEQTVPAEKAFPYTEHLSGVTKIEGDLILITDLDKFLSLNEFALLNKAIEEIV